MPGVCDLKEFISTNKISYLVFLNFSKIPDKKRFQQINNLSPFALYNNFTLFVEEGSKKTKKPFQEKNFDKSEEKIPNKKLIQHEKTINLCEKLEETETFYNFEQILVDVPINSELLKEVQEENFKRLLEWLMLDGKEVIVENSYSIIHFEKTLENMNFDSTEFQDEEEIKSDTINLKNCKLKKTSVKQIIQIQTLKI